MAAEMSFEMGVRIEFESGVVEKQLMTAETIHPNPPASTYLWAKTFPERRKLLRRIDRRVRIARRLSI